MMQKFPWANPCVLFCFPRRPDRMRTEGTELIKDSTLTLSLSLSTRNYSSQLTWHEILFYFEVARCNHLNRLKKKIK